MKNHFLIFFLLIVGLGISQTAKPKKKIKAKRETAASPMGKSYAVEIKITQTSAYCGGARPTPEMINYLSTPKAADGKSIFVKKGSKNTFENPVLMELITDTAGIIKLQLPPGIYFIVEEPKKDSVVYYSLENKYKDGNNYEAFDKNCLRTWFEAPDLVFEVKAADQKNLKFNYHRGCKWTETPCAKYKGPKPQ